MFGNFTTNGNKPTIKVQSKTHIHIEGAFQSGTAALQYQAADGVFRPVVGETYTVNSDVFIEFPYGTDLRLALTGATDETITSQDETDFDGVANNGTFVGGDGAGPNSNTIAAQDETDYDGVDDNGPFVGGDTSTLDQTIAAQDETDFDGAAPNGTFVGGDDTTASAETIAAQDETDFDNSPTTEGTFAGGAGYFGGVTSDDYAAGLVFTTGPNVVTRSDGTAFDTDGVAVGQKLVITNSENAGENNGTFTITGVTATAITVTESFTANADDDTAVLAIFDSITLDEGSVITVDNAGTAGTGAAITEFTVTSNSTSFFDFPVVTALLQSSTSGAGTGFVLTVDTDNILDTQAYAAADTITLSEGSVITVDVVDAAGQVTEFTVTTKSTAPFDFPPTSVLTQSSTSGVGVGFQITVDTNNVVGTAAYEAADTITLSEGSLITVDVVSVTGEVTEFTVTTNTVTPFDFPTVSNLPQASTSGIGVGFEITVGINNVVDSTVYAALDTITLDEGSIITVDAIDGNGDVTQFTVTTNSTSDAGGPTAVLTQASTDGGGSGFVLTLGLDNVVAPAIYYEIS